MFKLPIFGNSGATPSRPPQPYSGMTLNKQSRLRGATRTDSICPYCAVGCATHIYTKNGQVIDIEGNPQSPINEGTLCPKGANTFQLKSTRDAGYKEKNDAGNRLNAVTNMGSLGGATLDNEENYLIKKLFGAGLQMVSIENQARI
jgi:formate dehydrogenase major subunit